MWWIVDRSCATRDDDDQAEALMGELIAVIDRIHNAHPVFGKVYQRRAQALVDELQEHGYVVRFADAPPPREG